MDVLLCHLLVASSDVDEYVTARRRHNNPAMGDQPGYEGSVLLRPRDDEDPVPLALLNSWASTADQQRFATSSRCHDVERRVAHLVRRRDVRRYRRIDDASVAVGDAGTAAMCSIGFHQAIAGRGEDYLAARRDVANPIMSKAPGFVGVSVCADPDDEDRFMVFLQWANDAAADDCATPEHSGMVFDAIHGVLAHRPASQHYDVLVWHTPGSGNPASKGGGRRGR
ncbi:MAG: antibiotic biosynthesis monooxygenase family protein [Acidimicrobiales bacterium]